MSDQRGYFYARERAGSVARAMIDGGASPDRTLATADRVFSDTLDLATGKKCAKPATAARLTREIRQGDRAVAFADRSDQTGALHSLKMRVKKCANVNVADRPASYPADMCAARIDSARTATVRELESAIRAFRSGRNGAAKDAARGKIRAILHTWDGDCVIRDTAVNAGWRL